MLSIHCDLYSLGPISCQNENLSYPIYKKKELNCMRAWNHITTWQGKKYFDKDIYLCGCLVMWTFLPQRRSGTCTVSNYVLKCPSAIQSCSVSKETIDLTVTRGTLWSNNLFKGANFIILYRTKKFTCQKVHEDEKSVLKYLLPKCQVLKCSQA